MKKKKQKKSTDKKQVRKSSATKGKVPVKVSHKKSVAKKPAPRNARERRLRQNLYNKVYRRRLKLEKLKRTRKKEKLPEVNKQLKKLNSQIIHIRGDIRDKNKKIGVRQKVRPIREKKKGPTEVETAGSFVKDPNSPYIVWQAWRHFDEQMANPSWKWFIMNGKRMSADNKAEIEFEAQIMWGDGNYEDDYDVWFNPITKTIKYEKK